MYMINPEKVSCLQANGKTMCASPAVFVLIAKVDFPVD